MKKKILSLAIAAALAPGFAAASDGHKSASAAAASANVNGFADILYTISDDNSGSPSTTEGKFSANGEADFSASPADGVTVRIDVDLSLDPGATQSGAAIEQAFFAWGATEGITVLGGVFNNPIGLEAEDAPDMWGTNHGVVYNILNQQTALDGDNIAGLAGAFAVGPATITVAYLNDLNQTNEENSVAVVVNASPIKGLDLELGYVSQADQTKNAGSAENVTNFNASYAIPGVEGLSVSLDYLTAGKIVDSAYELAVGYTYGSFGVGVRTENVGWEASGAADSERNTFHVTYKVASNLVAILEVADGDNVNPATAVTGIEADGLTTLELIATF